MERNIKVYVRIRPKLGSEQHKQSCEFEIDEQNGVISKLDNKQQKQYKVDRVFLEQSEQEDIFVDSGIKKSIDNALIGYNLTILAYGQTGSGKTFTIEGYKYQISKTLPEPQVQTTPECQLGLVPRSLKYIFQNVDLIRQHDVSVRLSFVQIYMEQVYDLLSPNASSTRKTVSKEKQFKPVQQNLPSLKLKWDLKKGFYLQGALCSECTSYEDAMRWVQRGLKNKIMASHRLNDASSRSHTVLQVQVSGSLNRDTNNDYTSNITFVDLAGSEKQSQTGCSGKAQQQSIFINKSLFTLRKVIATLSDSRYSNMHVPYRDSKLTSLLQNSFGGSSITYFIACISPLLEFKDDVESTLDYACKAKRVQNTVIRNEDPKSKRIRELEQEINSLRNQMESIQSIQVNIGQGAQQSNNQSQFQIDNSSAWQQNQDSFKGTNSQTSAIQNLKKDEKVQKLIGNRSLEMVGRYLVQCLEYIYTQQNRCIDLQKYQRTAEQTIKSLQKEFSILQDENITIRHKLSTIEGAILMKNKEGDQNGPLTSQQAALIELSELREQNQYLQKMVDSLESNIQTNSTQKYTHNRRYNQQRNWSLQPNKQSRKAPIENTRRSSPRKPVDRLSQQQVKIPSYNIKEAFTPIIQNSSQQQQENQQQYNQPISRSHSLQLPISSQVDQAQDPIQQLSQLFAKRNEISRQRLNKILGPGNQIV